MFGNVDKVRHLMGVLAGRCEDAGRDAAQITKTNSARLRSRIAGEVLARAIR